MSKSSWNVPCFKALTLLLLALFLLPLCSRLAIAQAPELVITSDINDAVLRFDGVTGNFITTLRQGSHAGGCGPSSLAISPDGRLYMALCYAEMIVRLNPVTMKFEFFSNKGALHMPHQIAFGPDGDLYVANYGNHQVDRFDGVTGDFKNTVYSGFGGEVTGVAVDQSGNVYISERHGAVFKYDGITIPVFAAGTNPEALKIGPDGMLYVASQNHVVYRFKLDGTPFGANGNTSDPLLASGGGLNLPVGLAFGPDANLYVTDYLNNAVLKYDRVTGASLGIFSQISPLVDGAWGISFTGADVLTSVTVPTSINGGQSDTGQVHFSDNAPTGGAVVFLSSNNPAASVPNSVTVGAGKKNANFTITTTTVGADTQVAITATYIGKKVSATLTVKH